MKHGIVFGLLALGGFVPAHAQSVLPATVHVHVTDTAGVPLQGANVRIFKSGRADPVLAAAVDAAGKHTFYLQLDSGSYRIQAVLLGYLQTTRRLDIEPGDTITLDIAIVPLPHTTELPAVVSTEHYRIDTDPGLWEGFDQRCGSKLTSCFRQDYLSDHPSYDLLDILRNADGIIAAPHGVTSKRGGIAIPHPNMHGVAGGNCEPNYFVDGFLWAQASAWDQIVAAFGPEQIRGIEVYQTGQPRPLKFEGNKTPPCGSIVVWTK